MSIKIWRAEAYYKNDKPGGLGIIYEFRGDGGARFVANFQQALKTWDENADPKDLFSQLDELGLTREHERPLTERENRVAFMNISWLELRGHLKSDRFNGAIFLPDGTRPVRREQKSTTRPTPAPSGTLHRSLNLLRLINRAHPDVWLAYDLVRSGRAWPDYVFVPRYATIEVMKQLGIEDWLYKAEVLTAMAAWRPTQGIYRFAPALLDALLETPVVGAIPRDVLHRIPEWCVYLEVEREVHGHLLHGAWVHLDLDGGDELLGLIVSYGTDCLVFQIPLTEAIDGALAGFTVVPLSGSVLASSDDPRAHFESVIVPVISLLLYVCSTNAEVHDPTSPSRTPSIPIPHVDKRGRARWYGAQQATIWETGARLGAALDAAKVFAASTESCPTGKSVRPHVRRAHWHGVWTGPRDDPEKRQFKLNWWSPILVNFEDREAPDTATIRPVEGKNP